MLEGLCGRDSFEGWAAFGKKEERGQASRQKQYSTKIGRMGRKAQAFYLAESLMVIK